MPVENACGEASSSTDADGKEFSCPTCERTFDTIVGMRYHHATTHGESIAKTEKECQHCGDMYEVRKSYSDSSRFCSKPCKYDYQRHSQCGENNANWGGGKVQKECVYCGEGYEKVAARAKKSRFCSYDCMHNWQSENWTGENHHMWVGEKPSMDCEVCGKTFKIRRDKLEARRFCSNDCRGVAHSEYISGENHPCWKENTTQRYGPNWKDQAPKARQRDDYECQICGLPQEDHFRKLGVHHMTPRSEFLDEDGNYDWEKGNKLENLVTLCVSCHRKYEGWAVLPLY